MLSSQLKVPRLHYAPTDLSIRNFFGHYRYRRSHPEMYSRGLDVYSIQKISSIHTVSLHISVKLFTRCFHVFVHGEISIISDFFFTYGHKIKKNLKITNFSVKKTCEEELQYKFGLRSQFQEIVKITERKQPTQWMGTLRKSSWPMHIPRN